MPNFELFCLLHDSGFTPTTHSLALLSLLIGIFNVFISTSTLNIFISSYLLHKKKQEFAHFVNFGEICVHSICTYVHKKSVCIYARLYVLYMYLHRHWTDQPTDRRTDLSRLFHEYVLCWRVKIPN